MLSIYINIFICVYTCIHLYLRARHCRHQCRCIYLHVYMQVGIRVYINRNWYILCEANCRRLRFVCDYVCRYVSNHSIGSAWVSNTHIAMGSRQNEVKVKADYCCMLTDSQNWQYVSMCILVLKSYSLWESAGMTELGAHDESVYSVYKLVERNQSG